VCIDLFQVNEFEFEINLYGKLNKTKLSAGCWFNIGPDSKWRYAKLEPSPFAEVIHYADGTLYGYKSGPPQRQNNSILLMAFHINLITSRQMMHCVATT
jgi:hypothetical protein